MNISNFIDEVKKYTKYISYVIKHKWFVFLAGLKIGTPIWRLIVHDLSKFLPSEIIAYANYFYGVQDRGAFNLAWLKHQHRNPHHWQYWILNNDTDNQTLLKIPDEYILEMVADWAGAGRAITGKWDLEEWYAKNREKQIIDEYTKSLVDYVVQRFVKKIKNKQKNS